MPLDDLPFQLGAQHGQSLVQGFLLRIAVDPDTEIRQLPQGDAVIPFQGGLVVIVHADAQHRQDGGRAAGAGAQPENVMIAPLDVHIGVLHQTLNDAGRVRPPVKNIPHHMQPVHRQTLDQRGHGDNQTLRRSGIHNGGNDGVAIAELVGVLVPLYVQQLVQHKRPFLGHAVAHIAAGVLAGEHLRQDPQMLNNGAQRGVIQLSPLPENVQLLLRVIDHGTEGVAPALAQLLPEKPQHLFQNDAGAVVEDVADGGVFPVQVADEMLRPLGQRQNGAEIDQLRAGGGLIGIFLGQKLQILPVKLFHISPSVFIFSSPNWSLFPV